MQFALTEYGTTLEVRDDACVVGQRAALAPNLSDAAAALREALEQPQQFPPLRRAITPHDRIAVVVDERLPLRHILAGALLTYLAEAGVVAEEITLVSPAGAGQDWVTELPDAVQDVRTEIHHPANRRNLSYLATTKKGRRIYMNRTLVDADQTVVIAGNRYDQQFGIADAATALFPAFSDEETLAAFDAHGLVKSAGAPGPAHQEAIEVVGLLGVPFLVHVVEGSGNALAHIVGGTADAAGESHRLMDARWHVRFARPAHTVVVTVGGDPNRQDFETLARAALCGARVVEPNGRVVILSHSNAPLNDIADLIRQAENPEADARGKQKRRPANWLAARMWLEATRTAQLYLLGGPDEDTVEEIYATQLQHARQAQRLLDAASSCLVIEDAHKTLATVSP